MDEAAKLRNEVETRKHIDEVRWRLYRCLLELLSRQLHHDASKLTSPERDIFAEWVPKLADTTYGSPEYSKMLDEIRPALEHHYANNRHHPEYWKLGIRGMDLIDLIEMICDWCAAAKRHTDGDVSRSIEVNQQRFGYSDELKQIFVNTVDQLHLR